MKRVEVGMDNSFRGFVQEYANQTDKTMPQAYNDLMELGILVCNLDLNFTPNIDVDEEMHEDVVAILERDEDQYDLFLDPLENEN